MKIFANSLNKLTVFLRVTKDWLRNRSVAHPRVSQHLNAVVGKLFERRENCRQRCCFSCIHVVVICRSEAFTEKAKRVSMKFSHHSCYRLPSAQTRLCSLEANRFVDLLAAAAMKPEAMSMTRLHISSHLEASSELKKRNGK